MNEIDKLILWLYDSNCLFQYGPFEGDLAKSLKNPGKQVFYPSKKDCIYDFVSHDLSYGGKEGFIEMMDHRTNEVLGNLTAVDAFDFIKAEENK